MSKIKDKIKYDVALSFAEEDREIAKKLANALREKEIEVFYDKFYKSDLWGKNLADYFQESYGRRVRFVIPLVSKYYPIKDGANFEFSVAVDEAKRRKNEFLLPVRLDDTKILGLPYNIGYLDFNKEKIEGIVKCIVEKLKKDDPRLDEKHIRETKDSYEKSTETLDDTFRDDPVSKRFMYATAAYSKNTLGAVMAADGFPNITTADEALNAYKKAIVIGAEDKADRVFNHILDYQKQQVKKEEYMAHSRRKDVKLPSETIKVELKKTFSEKDAARLALSFKTVQELDRMCNRDAKTEEFLDKLSVLSNYTEGSSDKFTKQLDEFSRFMEQEQIGYLDDEYKGKVRRFCTNLIDVWMAEFLR